MIETHLFLLILVLFMSMQVNGYKHLKTSTSNDVQQEAVRNLIKRILPERHEEFSVVVDSFLIKNDKELFRIKKVNGKIQISGNTGVVASTGFHYYLKYYCNAHISWEASQLDLPQELPDLDIEVILNDKFRYYQNVCTTSYNFVWWSWKQWEKHIDWIVLNSFNFVLASNGQEAIWQRVYKKLGLTNKDVDEHFSGPAFLSWLRMGNLRGWGGPLSDAWHTRSLFLQHKIFQRMRDFGIVTILPAFAGHLPRAFQRIYPDVNMTMTSDWNNFQDEYCCPLFLNPTEELFQTVGRLFIEEQIAEYGSTDHAYNCDSFNELDPGNPNLTYLSNVGKSIYSAMKQADPQAVWVMQGWLFVHSFLFWTPDRAKALLTSIPQGSMIVLDLQSEQFPQYQRLDQYFGQPFIWCMLHNFGGTLSMYGSAEIINTNVLTARNDPNSTMIGTGLTMEGINQNYVIYDLMTEQAWRKEPVNLSDWFRDYSRRRYGKNDENAEIAWEVLKNTLYNFSGIQRQRGQFAITRTPSLDIDTWGWYNVSDVFNAWNSLIAAAVNLHASPAYQHDLVDLTRQVLQINGDIYYNMLVSAFNNGKREEFDKIGNIFRGIFVDLESILATNEAFLLGNWLEDAKASANDSNDEKLFEFNAKNQITLWGPYGEIMNYAIKQWSGVVQDFLYPRWDEFLYGMNISLVHNYPFNQTLEQCILFFTVEEPFVFSRKIYPRTVSGDTVQIAKTIQERHWYQTHGLSIPKFKTVPVRRRKISTKYRKHRLLDCLRNNHSFQTIK